MVECGSRAGSRWSRAAAPGVVSRVERHRPPERQIFGAPDDTHASSAHGFQQAVVRDDLASSQVPRQAHVTRKLEASAALLKAGIPGAQIYGFEESGSVRALVMELVEGEDLAESRDDLTAAP
jgi:hypothetical protein